jgi:MFS family permease
MSGTVLLSYQLLHRDRENRIGINMKRRGDSAVETNALHSNEQPGISRWWRVAGGLSMNVALGTLYGWSVFVAPLEQQFGWKRADTSMVFTIAVVVFALTFVVAGRIQDKFGPLYCSLAGGILVSLGFYLCSYITSLNDLFIGHSGISVGGWHEIKATTVEVDGGDEVGFAAETAGGVLDPLNL